MLSAFRLRLVVVSLFVACAAAFAVQYGGISNAETAPSDPALATVAGEMETAQANRQVTGELALRGFEVRSANPPTGGARVAAAAAELELADLLALADMKRTEIDDKFAALQEKSVLVVNGVKGDPAYGEDSALYGAMGFVRKSERASGLTRKVKPNGA